MSDHNPIQIISWGQAWGSVRIGGLGEEKGKRSVIIMRLQEGTLSWENRVMRSEAVLKGSSERLQVFLPKKARIYESDNGCHQSQSRPRYRITSPSFYPSIHNQMVSPPCGIPTLLLNTAKPHSNFTHKLIHKPELNKRPPLKETAIVNFSLLDPPNGLHTVLSHDLAASTLNVLFAPIHNSYS